MSVSSRLIITYTRRLKPTLVLGAILYVAGVGESLARSIVGSLGAFRGEWR